jgi:hypothetical protein
VETKPTEKSTDLQKVEPQQIQTVDNDAPLMIQVIQLVQSGKLDTDQMTAMLEFGERIEANEARKAFHIAMAAFKADPPTIFKNNTVSYGEGDKATSYKHTTLASLAEILDKSLSKFDLSFKWKTEDLEKGIIKVTCILTHKLGHSEFAELSSLPDASGGKNPIQAKGSAVTYLQRYTLKSVTGVAEKGQDDDGATAGDNPTPKAPAIRPLSTTELEVIDAICEKLPPAGTGYVLNKGRIAAILMEKARDYLVFEKVDFCAGQLMEKYAKELHEPCSSETEQPGEFE